VKTLTLLFFFILSSSIFAAAFSITNRSYGSLTTEEIAQFDALLNSLEADVNGDLPDADQSSYLKGMANANIMAGKGVSDYANDVRFFLLKYSVGIGADIGDNTMSDVLDGTIKPKQLRGASFQFGFTFGLSMNVLPFKKIGFLETKKADLFFHIASFDSNSDDQTFTVSSSAIGAYFRYQISEGVEVIPFGGLDWQGVFLTFGAEAHETLLKLNVDVAVTETVSGLGSATLAGSVLAGVDVDTLSIPLELSTNFQWLYFFTTYMGLGVDYNMGTATSLANSSTTLSSDIADVGGQGQIDLGTTHGPSPIWTRWFIGQQINLTLLKFNVQIDHVPGKGYWGANAGIALTF
jgi:hypothetical protein